MVYLKKDKDMIRRAAWVFIVFAIILTFTSSPVDAALSRDNAVANMKKQATVGWSTQKDVTIYYTPKVSSKTYYKGTTYKGIPYSQCRPGNSYQTFDFICGGSEDGVFSLATCGSSSTDNGGVCVGNDCSTAVLRAQEAAGKTFSINKTDSLKNGSTEKWGNTATILASAISSSDGIKFVGKLTYANGDSASSICTKNGKSAMTTAYKLLQKGDSCVKDGHIILITAVSSTGITYTDQYGYNINGYSSWHNGSTMIWSDMYIAGYVPITIF